MTDASARPQRRNRRRAPVVDELLGAARIAEALDVSKATVHRILTESATSRAGLWPQLMHRGKRVCKASTVQAYIDELPCIEDIDTAAA